MFNTVNINFSIQNSSIKRINDWNLILDINSNWAKIFHSKIQSVVKMPTLNQSSKVKYNCIKTFRCTRSNNATN